MLSLIPKTHCTTWGLVTWVVGDGTSAEEGVVWTGSRVHLNGLLGTCSNSLQTSLWGHGDPHAPRTTVCMWGDGGRVIGRGYVEGVA